MKLQEVDDDDDEEEADESDISVGASGGEDKDKSDSPADEALVDDEDDVDSEDSLADDSSSTPKTPVRSKRAPEKLAQPRKMAQPLGGGVARVGSATHTTSKRKGRSRSLTPGSQSDRREGASSPKGTGFGVPVVLHLEAPHW